MGFLQFFRILWAWRGVVLLTTITSFLAASLIVYLLPQQYEAKSRLVMEFMKPDPVTGEVMSSTYARTYVNTQTELIKDYRIAGIVVDKLGWTSNPALAAAYQNRSEDDQRDFRRWLAQRVIDNTTAKLIDNSNILEITYTTSSPTAARVVADALREAYVEQTLSARRETARRNADWFRQQTEKVRAELASAEDRKTKFERENGIILQDNNVDTETTKLSTIAAAAPAAPALALPPAPVSSPSTAALAQIDAQIATASQTLGPNHPDLQAMRQQRAAVAQAAASELAAARAASRASVSGPNVASMLSAQTQKVLAQRDKVGEAQRLAVDVTVLRDQFNKTAARAAELEQESQSTETGITVLGAAIAPDDPSWPNVPLIIAGSIGLGLMIGVLSSLLFELISRRVRGVEDLIIPGVPVIGAMARAADEKQDMRLLSRLRRWLGFDRPFLRKAAG